MKRYTDYSKAELKDLKEEDIQKLIDIEIAYAGIIPVMKPIPFVKNEVSIQPSEVAYEIYGIIFKDADEALAFSKMNILSSNYDYYSSGCKYKWLEPKSEYNSGVKTEKYYKKDDIESVKKELTENKERESRYSTEKSAYDKYLEQTRKISEAVYREYYDALDFYKNVKAAVVLYTKYVVLAEGNKNVALSFIEDAYKDKPEIITAFKEEIIEHKEEVTI